MKFTIYFLLLFSCNELLSQTIAGGVVGTYPRLDFIMTKELIRQEKNQDQEIKKKDKRACNLNCVSS